ncbi:MAG: hypothetical protein HUJ51_05540 [Eggerthellaceae bacterium]|nr:hypothetical protein [Eggerthellaceae bacterium]
MRTKRYDALRFSATATLGFQDKDTNYIKALKRILCANQENFDALETLSHRLARRRLRHSANFSTCIQAFKNLAFHKFGYNAKSYTCGLPKKRISPAHPEFILKILLLKHYKNHLADF